MNIVASLAGSAVRMATDTLEMPSMTKAVSKGPVARTDNPLMVNAARQAATDDKIRSFPLARFRPDKTLFKTMHPLTYTRLTDDEHHDANVLRLLTKTWAHNYHPTGGVSPEGFMRMRGQAHPWQAQPVFQ